MARSQSLVAFVIGRGRIALLPLVLLTTLSCAKYERVPPPSLSPAVSDRGSIHLTLNVAPDIDAGPGTRAEAIYGMANERQCSPKDYSSAIGGRWNNFVHRATVDVVRESQHSYVARVPSHPMKDEDYYGLGVCRWKLSVVVFDFGFPGYLAVTANNVEVGHAEFLCIRDGRGLIAQCAESSSVPLEAQADRVSITVKIDKE